MGGRPRLPDVVERHVKRRQRKDRLVLYDHTGPAAVVLVLCLRNGWCFVAPRLACGEARGGSIPRSGAVTDEQRSHRPTWGQPEGRQVFSVQASLLAPYRSTSGYARRSRLAWTENPLPQNTSHLGGTTLVWCPRNGENVQIASRPRL